MPLSSDRRGVLDADVAAEDGNGREESSEEHI
jgi:hypothetical protein